MRGVGTGQRWSVLQSTGLSRRCWMWDKIDFARFMCFGIQNERFFFLRCWFVHAGTGQRLLFLLLLFFFFWLWQRRWGCKTLTSVAVQISCRCWRIKKMLKNESRAKVSYSSYLCGFRVPEEFVRRSPHRRTNTVHRDPPVPSSAVCATASVFWL